jgi:hypothetical protein
MIDQGLAEAERAAAELLGGPVGDVAWVRGFGRNSGIFCVRQAGKNFALKRYPQYRAGERNRAETEFGALRFLTEHGIHTVPRAIAADGAEGYAVLEWIDGEAVPEPGEADIDAACRFLASVHTLRNQPDAREQPAAAEACLSGAETVAQIDRRLRRLGALADTEPALAEFLDGAVQPLFARIAAWAEAGYATHVLAFAEPITEDKQTLCPADFGFHNAMRRPSGELAFIDFDYFGWDDPVKLVCDFLLHPGMQIREPLKRRFADTAREIYATDDSFAVRLPLLFPLFALRWSLILLNEFLPERWAQRVNARGPADWSSVKQEQLDRARRSVQSLATNFRWFPYGS